MIVELQWPGHVIPAKSGISVAFVMSFWDILEAQIRSTKTALVQNRSSDPDTSFGLV